MLSHMKNLFYDKVLDNSFVLHDARLNSMTSIVNSLLFSNYNPSK